MQQQGPPLSAPGPVSAGEQHSSIADGARDERRETFEPAARKMEVDEDYDDEGEDDKRVGGSGGRNSPTRSSGMMNGQAKSEVVA